MGEGGRDGGRNEEGRFDFLQAVSSHLDYTAGSLRSSQYSLVPSLSSTLVDYALIGLDCGQDNAIFIVSQGNSILHPG